MDVLIKILIVLIVIVLCGVLEEAVSRASARVTVRVFPLVILKTSDVKVTALFEPGSANRYVSLDWISNVAGGNSTRPIEDAEQESAEFTVRDVPPVDTWFVVTLYGVDNKVLATGRARVAGPGDK